jgi:hypothetical protein
VRSFVLFRCRSSRILIVLIRTGIAPRRSN